ncbi:hypothetical protein AZE42_11119 [Rhizopogon vesiculosus]|uniref:Uncharacterized protein n=1 Tax=Rhizopogon vesiculosus TaxID=180088 RepID=A0A1J8QQ40_9AGAM|nr:hypothetical protein AZE42_11119 [Rhizopogon vesiculosus]
MRHVPSVHPSQDTSVDDMQHMTCALQAAEMQRLLRAEVTLDIVESWIDKAQTQIPSATSCDVLRAIRNELAVIATTLTKVEHKFLHHFSQKSAGSVV